MGRTQQKDMISKAIQLYVEVFRFAFRKIKDKDAAQDIAQNVMEIVISKMHTLKNTEALKSWVMKITANEINAYFRKIEKYRKNTIDLQPDDGLDIIEQLQDLEADILEKLTREESQYNVIKALLRLETIYQDIIRDHLVYEIPFTLIAEKRKIKYNTVKTRYKRGIESLKKEFEKVEKGGGKDE